MEGVLGLVLVNVHALHCTPFRLMWTCHSYHFHLPVDGPAERASRDAQVHVRVGMLEPDPRVLPPEVARADHLPVITTVALALLVAVATDLLVAREWTREVVRVQVLVGGYVVQADDGAACHRLTSLTVLVHLALDGPMAIDIVFQLGCGHRLLTRPGTVFNVMGVQSHLVSIVQQLYHGPTGNVLGLGSCNRR